jgi:hypothetical protein
MECASDSEPSEARKRGSGGGSPRKCDDLLTGPSDLDDHSRQSPPRLASVEPPSPPYARKKRAGASPHHTKG